MTKSVVTTTIFDLTSILEIELIYYRPIAQGRKIFGDLVPYDYVWRTGADGNTTVYFSEDIEIGGQILQKGKYAIFTIPAEDSWRIIFYAEYNNMGVPRVWTDENIALICSTPSERTNAYVESFTMGVNNLGNGEGSLELAWENTRIAIKFTMLHLMKVDPVATNAYRMASFYYSAAEFYYKLKDLPTALMLVNKSIAINEFQPSFYFSLRALIEAEMIEH